MSKETPVLLTNRSASAIGYTSYEGRPRYLHAAGRPGDTISITKEEIKQLGYTKGGLILLEKYLYIQDPETVLETIGEQEQEYFLDAKSVEELLLKGTEDDLLEALDYAPSGVIDLIKDIAVNVRLDSSQKRALIQEKTGFNVDQAIRNSIQTEVPEKPTKAARAPRKPRTPKE